MSSRITRIGTMRVDALAADIFDDRGMVATIVNYTTDPESAHAMHGQRVRIIVEPVPPEPEPLTGGDADINVRVRIKRDWLPAAVAGRIGVLARYDGYGHAHVRVDGGYHVVPVDQIERPPAECPHCGASQVSR